MDFFGTGTIEVWLGAKTCAPVQERPLHIRGFEQIPRLKAKFLAFSIRHTQGFVWRRGRDDASFTDIFWLRPGALVYISGAVL